MRAQTTRHTVKSQGDDKYRRPTQNEELCSSRYWRTCRTLVSQNSPIQLNCFLFKTSRRGCRWALWYSEQMQNGQTLGHKGEGAVIRAINAAGSNGPNIIFKKRRLSGFIPLYDHYKRILHSHFLWGICITGLAGLREFITRCLGFSQTRCVRVGYLGAPSICQYCVMFLSLMRLLGPPAGTTFTATRELACRQLN